MPKISQEPVVTALSGSDSYLVNASGVTSTITKKNALFDGIYLQLAANPDTIIAGTITRDANEAATSAPVVWPDGTAGTYTATSVSSTFPGAVDAYTITFGAHTFTQSTVTRDASGAVTVRPAITVT